MEVLKRTPLFPVYEKYNARVVDFAGWELPVSFAGIKEEHRAVREKAGIFDVSHMGEIYLRGPGALEFLQIATCNDVSRINIGAAQYSAILNPNGGIIDDIFIYRTKTEEYLLCVNAGNAEADFAWLSSLDRSGCELENQSKEWAQIALQGPESPGILEGAADVDVKDILRLHIMPLSLAGTEVLAARSGYTGEDGFEFFIPAGRAVDVWDALMEKGKAHGLQPCGLGARDTLRLEMGYPLHGHDITPETTPLEADLAWITAMYKKDFIGKDALEKQKKNGVQKKRVGLYMEEPGIPRDGYKIIAPHGEGKVTSGTKTPCVTAAIAMGYVPAEDSQDGTRVSIDLRGKPRAARVGKWPFFKLRLPRPENVCEQE